MMPLEIAPKIYDVGVVDWAVRDFHGYKTERGASYNSYLIMDEKICLIDTVKAMFAEELLAKIERVVDPGKIDYVIVNHVEPDHAGALPALVKAAPLDLKMIATAHGIIWRSHIQEIIAKYAAWGKGVNGSSVVIAYDTMWGATEQMARAVLEGVVSAGSDAVLLRMNETPNSTVVADLFEAGGMILGSSTLNSGMLPTMGSLLVYLKGLNPTGKKAAVFGTYGWAGGAQKDMEALLTAAGFELEPGFTCKWKAQPEDLEVARQLGYEFARKLQK